MTGLKFDLLVLFLMFQNIFFKFFCLQYTYYLFDYKFLSVGRYDL